MWYRPLMPQTDDPAPGMLFMDALKILEGRYGVRNIEHHPTNGDVVIYLPEFEGSEVLWPYVFTDRQAKYLAVNHVSNKDIRQSRFPADWPPRPKTAAT